MIIKGKEQYPSAPIPHLTEFGLEIPLTSAADVARREAEKEASEENDDDNDDEGGGTTKKADNSQQAHEQAYILSRTLRAQLSSQLATQHHAPTPTQQHDLSALQVSVDRSLLQLLGLACLAGEEHGMRALEIVRLMRGGGNASEENEEEEEEEEDDGGKMLELAGKVAARYGRDVLGEKIREVAEERAVRRGRSRSRRRA